jgi:biotin carboxylase
MKKLYEYRIGVMIFWARSSEEAIKRAENIIKDFEIKERTLLKKDERGLWRIESIIFPNR